MSVIFIHFQFWQSSLDESLKMGTLAARRIFCRPLPSTVSLIAAWNPSCIKPSTGTLHLRHAQHSAVHDMLQKQKYDNLYKIDISKINVDSIKAEFLQHGGGSITLSKDNETGIAKITLSNPKIRGAISGKMMCDLHDAILDLEGWNEGKGLILLSDDPKFFSSGADLKFAKAHDSHEGGYKMSTLMHDSLWRLSFLPYLTVSLVKGRAIGGGAELCTATDFRVFSPSGSVTFVQSKMGLTTGWGGGSRLVKIVGQREALKALVKSQEIEAKEAAELGLCDLITYAEDKAIYETENWLNTNYLENKDIDVIKGMKSICLQANFGSDLEECLEHEKLVFTKSWGGEAFHSAVSRKIKHR